MKLNSFFIFLFLSCLGRNAYASSCGNDTLQCRIYFPIGSSVIDFSYRNNGLRLDSFLNQLSSLQEYAVLRRVRLCAGASPEGNTSLNKNLSDARCQALHSYLQKRLSLPDSVFVPFSLGEDWEELGTLIEQSAMPYREEALRILHETPVWVIKNKVVVDSRKRQLMMLDGGRVWSYMVERFFSELRNSSVIECQFESVAIEQQRIVDEVPENVQQKDTIIRADTVFVLRDTTKTVYSSIANHPYPFYMAIKTNLLYDALLVPNIGIEFYLGKRWSVSGNWMYAWWKNDKRHRYWRLYGGEIGLRKYFGHRASSKPLTGHHVAVYGQMLIYDFEMGGRGYMGGRPGCSLWEKANYGAGIEYGYSLPVGRRLNLDFAMGAGYLGGMCYEYVPADEYYVWEKAKTRHWFGPTKAEISLVWLLGRGNYNEKKGGKQ